MMMKGVGTASASPSLDTLQQVLDETRQRFVATFDGQCDSIRVLLDDVASFGPEGPVAALRHVTHRMSGLAGTIGFPTVSVHACELEGVLEHAGGSGFDASLARNLLEAIRDGFTSDLASPPVWARPSTCAVQGATILVAEDESDQRAIVTACLAGAGYAPITVVSGDQVVDAARAEKPAVILLDIAMPRLDGYSACRLLKADPGLAAIPVIFMTTGANLDDKLAGLALGADEFLSKPVDMRELVLRIQLLLKRSPAGITTPPPAARAVRIIVIAEDDPDVTRIVDAQVRAARYKGIVAFDGEQALAAVRAHAPDVLVLDLMMPKLDGFDVLAQLRAGPEPRPRVIVLSGRGREQDVMRAFELGADDYVTKPFNPRELMARIARLLK